MAALLALGYSMLLQPEDQKENEANPPTQENQPSAPADANPTWASTLGLLFTPEAASTSTPPASDAQPSQPPQPVRTQSSPPPLIKPSRPSVIQRSTTKGELAGEHSRNGSSSGSTRRQKSRTSTKDLDEQYEKQMAKVARLMRKMSRAEQREKNARWKAAMQDVTLARAAGIDPQSDKVGWDEDSEEEDATHASNPSLKKPVTNLSAKPDDADAPAPESGDTLARFIHAMFTSMNPFDGAPHVEHDDDTKTTGAPSQTVDAQSKKPASNKDQAADTEVLRLLSSASAMNQDSRSRGSVWNVLDRLTPGRSKRGGGDGGEGSVMFSAPLFITEDSKVEVAHSEMRAVEEHESDSEDGKPRSSKFANLVNRMGMDGMFGSKKKAEEGKAEETEVIEVKAEPAQPKFKEVRVWRPSPDNISLQCSWWGYRIYLPPPVLAVLNDQKLEAAKRAALVTTALQWMIDHVPTALLPPQIGLVMSLVRGIIPALGYIGGFIAWSWSAIIGFDNGDGVVLSATWLLPIALIPGSWDAEPAPPEPAKKPEVEAAASTKAVKPSLSRSASFAKMMPSLERKGSTKSKASTPAEKKTSEKSTTEPKAIPKRPGEPTKRPSMAGPLPTPPSSVPRAPVKVGSTSSPPPVTKAKDVKPDANRPTLKKSTSTLGLNIVWSDKPPTEEPEADADKESLKKPSSFKLPMPDVTWDHERKAAEAEAAAKLEAEQEAKAAAKAKLKNKYAQALRDEMTKEKAPVGWSRFS
ncbi:hypothetical protein BDV93DRAFT_198777 [Ceratobasidium sp. AG-I]|nr:hypothetical protein BDV93DRAFT_198777 [Ceratobasidium sp. AG-I]